MALRLYAERLLPGPTGHAIGLAAFGYGLTLYLGALPPDWWRFRAGRRQGHWFGIAASTADGWSLRLSLRTCGTEDEPFNVLWQFPRGR